MKKAHAVLIVMIGFFYSFAAQAQEQVTLGDPVDTSGVISGAATKLAAIVASGIGVYFGFIALRAGVKAIRTYISRSGSQ